MRSRRTRGPVFASLVMALCLFSLSTGACAQIPPASTALPSNRPHDATREEYRAHLNALAGLVQACAKARDMKTCNPAEVGADDRVPIDDSPNAERRLIRYGWLRVLLSKAQDNDALPPAPKPAVQGKAPTWEDVRPAPPTTTQLLLGAQTRLAHDMAQGTAPVAMPPGHAQERAVMNQVLAEREFQDLEAPNPKDSAMEKVGNWLNRVLEGAMRASSRAPWLGRALVWGFVIAVCAGLVLALWRLERRWRIRLAPENRGPALGSASQVPWQQWMDNARRAAEAGQWREAIHFLYWAAISRLESKRLWPADRARTPREYLALIAPDDPRQPGLATLTRSFERTWYGGLPAAEKDYLRAEHIASALIAGHAVTELAAPESGRP